MKSYHIFYETGESNLMNELANRTKRKMAGPAGFNQDHATNAGLCSWFLAILHI